MPYILALQNGEHNLSDGVDAKSFDYLLSASCQ